MLVSSRFYLVFGLIVAIGSIAIPTVLGALLPGYDLVSQTMSEIGEAGSPFESVYQVFIISVAICLGLFSYGLRRYSAEHDLSSVPSWLFAYLAVTELGVATFASPHPLHNVFGISSAVGFFAPAAICFGWPKTVGRSRLRLVSGIATILVLLSTILNFLPLFLQPPYPPYLVEHYGLVQRSIFLVFYLWCGYLAFVLLRSPRASERENHLAVEG